MGGQGRLSPDWKRIHILKIKIQGDRQCSVKDLPVFLTDGGWAIDLEVMSRDTDKGVALKALASRLGIPREQVLAMGDSGNDCAMLRYAGIGAAMGNASELAKKAADVIAPSNREDGVAWMLRRAARGEI